jgi:predicted RNase H-like HicB family nuclease
MSASQYSVEVHPRPAAEGGGFIAVVPQLPICNATGVTAEEAAKKAVDAITQHLATKTVPA